MYSDTTIIRILYFPVFIFVSPAILRGMDEGPIIESETEKKGYNGIFDGSIKRSFLG